MLIYQSCERKTILLILSPESQVTLTILSTLRPLYHNPHSHSLQFTKNYYISYKLIYLFTSAIRIFIYFSSSISKSTLPHHNSQKIYYISYRFIYSLQPYVHLYIFRLLYHNPHFPITILTTTKLIRQGKKHRKNCECCPGHYLIVNHYSWMSWFKFRNVPVIVNCVTKSVIH